MFNETERTYYKIYRYFNFQLCTYHLSCAVHNVTLTTVISYHYNEIYQSETEYFILSFASILLNIKVTLFRWLSLTDELSLVTAKPGYMQMIDDFTNLKNGMPNNYWQETLVQHVSNGFDVA